jgi:hypothetical protein
MPVSVTEECPNLVDKQSVAGKVPAGYANSILSSSTLASEDLGYSPEIMLIGSSNEALKGETAVLDATDEESFTLDSFDRLIRKAYNQGKAFLLARVTTADPHDSTILYHSYYAAHHINKVLFRTQPELGLLHRMKAKNPLNNMNIIGDVDYFMIDPKAYEKAMKQLHIERKKDDFSKNTPSRKASMHRRTASDTAYTIKPKGGIETPQKPDSYQSSLMNSKVPSTTELSPPENQEKRRIQYEGKFFATDDDYLMKTEIREIFKKNSTAPEDYMLFTLFSNGHGGTIGPNGEITFNGRPNRQRVRREPASWSNLWGCINTTPTPALTNRFTGVLTNRGLAIFFLSYLSAAILALKFLIPFAYVYLVGFAFAFVFVLVLVLFVEAGPR